MSPCLNQSALLEVGKWVLNLYSFFGGVILEVKSHELKFMMLLCDLAAEIARKYECE